MSCVKCNSEHIVTISARCDDNCLVEHSGERKLSNVPQDLGLGTRGDYIEFSYCGSCGQIQHTFPLPLFDIKPVVVEPPAIKYVLLGDLLTDFYLSARSQLPMMQLNVKFRTLIKFLTPSEQEAFNHHWLLYLELSRLKTKYIEFDDYIVFLIDKYKNTQVLEQIVMV
jgi:hypothetical protein